MKSKVDKLIFFLGGRDLEMLTVRELLDEKGVPYYDKGLSWGAKASDYEEEIEKVIESGLTPVFVELTDNLELSQESRILVDHHVEMASRNNSTLRQVFELLEIPSEQWTGRC